MSAVPKTQKAIVFDEVDGPLQYKDIAVPTPAPNELLVNVLYSGVCHSDLHAWHGDLPIPLKLPLVGGHEGAGVVVGMGEEVKGWKIGDRAGVKWLNKPCMVCEQCELGHESMCPEALLSGFNKDGTFAQYCLADYIQAPKISPDVDLRGVAPLLCGGITVYKGLKAAQLKAGDWVAISGAGGGLGSMAVQYAKAMGYRVLGIDGGDQKKKAVLDIGAEAFVDFTKVDDVTAEVLRITDGGAHGVLNVSVSEAAINLSPNYVRPTGTVILLGLPKDAELDSSVFAQVVRSVTTRGSVVGNRADTREALGFYNRGLIKIPLHEGKLSELPEIFKMMEKGDIVGRYVVDTSK